MIKYKYYIRNRTNGYQIYRCIDNNKPFNKNFALIERFLENDNKWTLENEYSEGLLNDYMSGWFLPTEDEITEKEAISLIVKLQDSYSTKNEF